MHGVIVCFDDEKNKKITQDYIMNGLPTLFLANACFCLPFYGIEPSSEEHSSENRSMKLLERRYSIKFQSKSK